MTGLWTSVACLGPPDGRLVSPPQPLSLTHTDADTNTYHKHTWALSLLYQSLALQGHTDHLVTHSLSYFPLTLRHVWTGGMSEGKNILYKEPIQTLREPVQWSCKSSHSATFLEVFMGVPVVTGAPRAICLQIKQSSLASFIPHELWYILGELELSAEVKHV